MLPWKLKRFLVVSSVSIFVASVLIPLSSYAAGDPKAGKKIFETVCFACHGMDGKPMIPGLPDFTKGEAADGKKLADKTDAELAKSIKEGRMQPKTPGAPPMPPFGGGSPLNDKQLSDVIAYIRSLKK